MWIIRCVVVISIAAIFVSGNMHRKNSVQEGNLGFLQKLIQRRDAIFETASEMEKEEGEDMKLGEEEEENVEFGEESGNVKRNNEDRSDVVRSSEVRLSRSRRGMGFRMRCIPTTKRSCKMFKFNGRKSMFCSVKIVKVCAALD